jgi:type III pantothenate kinase
MLLAIDTGNTHTVLGCFEGAKLRKTWRVSTHPICTADEFTAKLSVLCSLEGLDPRGFESIVVSSVVPSFTAMLRYAFAGRALHVIDHKTPYSFTIKAEPPQSVGADRLVNAEAVVREYGAPAIIVDSGTATTICAVTRDRAYLGGAIMPGIELSIEALAKNTAKLFAVELVPPAKAIGSNTQEALRSGILLGYASMVDGMVRRFKQELGEPDAKVIATGGISQLLKGLTTELTHFDSELTLKGIAHLHDAIRTR